jgi:hypothetical protein
MMCYNLLIYVSINIYIYIYIYIYIRTVCVCAICYAIENSDNHDLGNLAAAIPELLEKSHFGTP